MTKPIRLALDLDGVIFDFNTSFIALARERFPVAMAGTPDAGPQYPHTWHYLHDYLSHPQVRDLWSTIIASHSFWATIPGYAWSEALLRCVLRRADALYFITSRSGWRVQDQTREALNVLTEEYLTGAVIPVANPDKKIPIINALECTHFIDDKPETIQLAAERCLNAKIAIWDQPWNRSRAWGPAVTRLTSVEEFRSWLD